MEVNMTEQETLDYINNNRKQLTKELKDGESIILYNSKDKKIKISKHHNKLHIFTLTYGQEKLPDLIIKILDIKYDK